LFAPQRRFVDGDFRARAIDRGLLCVCKCRSRIGLRLRRRERKTARIQLRKRFTRRDVLADSHVERL